MTLVEDIMTRHVVRVNADDPVKVVRHKLTQGGFHHLPVMEGQELIGIVSDRDVLGAVGTYIDAPSEQRQGMHAFAQRASQIMTPQPHTVLPNATVQAAGEMLLALDVSALPVVDTHGSLVGIVTWRDIMSFWVDGPPDQAG